MAARERVAGRIATVEALRAKKRLPRKLYVLHSAKGLDAIREAAGPVPAVECSRTELDALVGDVAHQGVVLEADPLPRLDADAWVKGAFPPTPLVAVLDGIEDPHNFGAIVRSAAACGACAVVFAKDRAAPISPAAVKSAAGAFEYIDLVQATNIVRCLKGLKRAGFWIVALDVHARKSLWDADLTGSIAVVVGSEGKGIRQLVREHCDFGLRIPVTGPITTLNASVSAAIAFAECLRQRSRC